MLRQRLDGDQLLRHLVDRVIAPVPELLEQRNLLPRGMPVQRVPHETRSFVRKRDAFEDDLKLGDLL
jgi:hypothetical protein